LGAGLDGIPAAAERRGVGQVLVAEPVDGHGVENRGRGDVDPLGDLGVFVAASKSARLRWARLREEVTSPEM
jgi:hypothetical protein